ncbi:hypothetical protein [Streptomyces sp. NPDC001530]|uniref:hypothetical protein n=1 Tax=Streptomyces sp. NPDC001530 TaxID=3364582 RepID=UPI0036A3B775
MVYFGPLRYLTEMKQDSDDNSCTHIEGKYLAQEAEYTNTNVPLGQLLVLDLTPKTTSSGTLRINELAWLATHRPRGATTDRLVLAGSNAQDLWIGAGLDAKSVPSRVID